MFATPFFFNENLISVQLSLVAQAEENQHVIPLPQMSPNGIHSESDPDEGSVRYYT